MTGQDDAHEVPRDDRTFVSAGVMGVHYARCWPCSMGADSQHYDPPAWHTWADREDVDHALKTGQSDPSKRRCGCSCAVVS